MRNLFQIKHNIRIVLLCFAAFFLSGCKWFDGDGKKTDTTAPIITLTGANPQSIEINDAYTELGATATDDDDGDITANIDIDASAVDTSTIGSYSVTYNVSDTAGNTAATQTRTVDVVGDLSPPVITLTGDNPQTIEVGATYTELNATATDNKDGDISTNVVIDDSTVDTNTVGSYNVTYDVADAAGNSATTQMRTVNIVDTTLPIITLEGANPQSTEVDAAYTELGARASDNYDGDISANVVVDSSTVDTSTVGNYNVTYNVSDASGNNANTVTRVINVGSPQGATLISANNGVNGFELYVTDGTAAGTELLKDTAPGPGSHFPSEFEKVNDILFFRAGEIWKSDGTEVGTVMVKDINLSGNSNPAELTNLDGVLYFNAYENITGRELWKSDGTEAGTVLVKDISSGNGSPNNLTVFNGVLYFEIDDGTNGRELWKSDGTEIGTVIVKDIRQVGSSSPSELTVVGDMLYFVADDGTNGRELWKTDGTEAGTIMVKDIRSGQSSLPQLLTNLDGTLYFVATDGINGHELWKSDGTEEGTVLVKDIYPGVSGGNYGSMIAINNTLYFRANDSVYGTELWKSDGTEAGTVMVKDIYSGTAGSNSSRFAEVYGRLAFMANDGTNGYELWFSDGTDAGTLMVDINVGVGSSWPETEPYFNQDRPLKLADGKLLFGAEDSINGTEFWVTDGTVAGTTFLKDINPGTARGFPSD